jgi:lycopene beta-cyclase
VHHGQGRNYCYIPSDRFYQSALDGINKHPTMQLKQGLSVVSVTAQHNHYLIKLSDETTVLSKQIIDTRPSSYTHSDQAKIWQIFYGIEIQAARPIFDTRCVGLMNHLASSKLGTQFVYILPFSTQHALIEWTVFSPKLSSPHLLEPQLHEWLQSEFGETKMNIIRTEQAVLPMGLKINRPNRDFASSYNYGGQIAGAIRPATGYAFLRIQRWAQACAKQLASDEPIKGHAPSRRIVRAMDDLFLTVLHDEPQKGALLFQALAEHVPPTTLVRFLSDEARILDYALVMKALPAKLFLKYSLSKILGLYRNKVTS